MIEGRDVHGWQPEKYQANILKALERWYTLNRDSLVFLGTRGSSLWFPKLSY